MRVRATASASLPSPAILTLRGPPEPLLNAHVERAMLKRHASRLTPHCSSRVFGYGRGPYVHVVRSERHTAILRPTRSGRRGSEDSRRADLQRTEARGRCDPRVGQHHRRAVQICVVRDRVAHERSSFPQRQFGLAELAVRTATANQRSRATVPRWASGARGAVQRREFHRGADTARNAHSSRIGARFGGQSGVPIRGRHVPRASTIGLGAGQSQSAPTSTSTALTLETLVAGGARDGR